MTITRVGTGEKAKMAVRFDAETLLYGLTAAPDRGDGRKNIVILLALGDNPNSARRVQATARA